MPSSMPQRCSRRWCVHIFIAFCSGTISSVSANGFDSLSKFVVHERGEIQQAQQNDEQPNKGHRFMRSHDKAMPRAAAPSLLQTTDRISSESDQSLGLHMSALRLFNSSRLPQNSKAIVSHICSDDWAPGVIALGGSLKNFPLPVDLVVMVSMNVSIPVRHLLSSVFDSVYVEEPIAPHPSIQRENGDCVTLQLRTWQLPYEKALYMDADMIALSSPVPLLAKYGELTAQKDDYGQFNGGMFVCKPNATSFALLSQMLTKFHRQDRVGIQPFMNYAFPRCSSPTITKKTSPRPGCWHGTFDKKQNKFSRNLNQSDLQRILGGEPHVYNTVHFSGDWMSSVKPWQIGCLAARDSTTKDDKMRMDVLNLWLRAFNSAKLPAGMENLADIQCPAFTCAEQKAKLDYVVLADRFDCITNATVNSLYEYASPRQVLLIAPAHVCTQHKADQANGVVDNRTRCFAEDIFPKGVSRGEVESWLMDRHGSTSYRSPSIGDSNSTEIGSAEMAQLLLQTIMKLGLVEISSTLGLGDNYIIWDSSTILLRDFCPFHKDGRINVMESAVGREHTCAKRHRAAFLQLTGREYQYSQKRELAFSSNHLIVNKQSMAKFLGVLGHRPGRRVHWSRTLLDIACPTIDDCACGFPEIAAYVSWLKLTKPESIAEVPKQFVDAQDFESRRPQGGGRRTMVARTPCCPSEHRSDIDKADGHLAVRFNRSSTCSGPPPDDLKPALMTWRRKQIQMSERNRWTPNEDHHAPHVVRMPRHKTRL